MTRNEILAYFDVRQDLWRAGDAAGLAATHAASGTLTSPLFGAVTGREAITQSYYQLFSIFVDWEVSVTHTMIDDLQVVQFYNVQAVHRGELFGVPATGRRFEIHPVLHCELDAAGLIQHETRRYDFSGMLIQLGVLRAKPGAV